MMNQQHDIVKQCRAAYVDAMEENTLADDFATATVNTHDGWIELYIDKCGASAAVCHNDDKEVHDNELLEEAIVKYAPQWQSFRPQLKPMLDPAFRDWNEYYDYMFG